MTCIWIFMNQLSSFFPLYPSRISQMNINSETILISSLIGRPHDLSYADKISVNIGWIIDSSHAGRKGGPGEVKTCAQWISQTTLPHRREDLQQYCFTEENISNHVAPQKRISPAFPNGQYIRISPTTLPCENRNKDIHRERWKALVIILN